MKVKFRSGTVLTEYVTLTSSRDIEEGETFIEYINRKEYLIDYEKNRHIKCVIIIGESDLIGCGA